MTRFFIRNCTFNYLNNKAREKFQTDTEKTFCWAIARFNCAYCIYVLARSQDKKELFVNDDEIENNAQVFRSYKKDLDFNLLSYCPWRLENSQVLSMNTENKSFTRIHQLEVIKVKLKLIEMMRIKTRIDPMQCVIVFWSVFPETLV